MEGFGWLVMELILDTNALWNRALLETLARIHEDEPGPSGEVSAVIPAIAFAERLRQVYGDEDREPALRGAIEDSGARIEPFTAATAERLAKSTDEGIDWHAHARDYLIAAHVHGERVGVTRDRGPAWEGVATITPDQAAKLVQAMSGG